LTPAFWIAVRVMRYARQALRTEDLNFELPAELIAQTPSERREQSRLMHYRRADRSIAHRHFSDLPSLLHPGDLLVFNDAKVIPARFMLRKVTGGRVEGLFLREVVPGRWRVLLRNAGGAGAAPLAFDRAPEVMARIASVGAGGEYEIEVETDEPALVLLSRVGRMPLPPYIKRDHGSDPRDGEDRQRYQTVYAKNEGSVAAPTAGLHFTPQLLAGLDAGRIERCSLTLDVGLGTFRPVTADTLEAHAMHEETYAIPADTADALNRAKVERRRIIAVGTTSARVLESQGSAEPFSEKRSSTKLLIQPPYAWKHVAALITNFHLPQSTLIALVAAMLGLDEQRRLYRTAIEQGYRFFSYGDAMFIE
jgi:S-adenosylmethionine:tRNA ribosyltransferase-isomerase